MFDNLCTAPPGPSLKLTTVATILCSTVKLMNHLSPLLLMAQSAIPVLTSHLPWLNNWPLSKLAFLFVQKCFCMVAPHIQAYTSNCKENLQMLL